MAELQAVATVPAPSLSELDGIAFDVDDTLTAGGVLQAEAVAALYQAKQAGLALVAATGRPLGWADVLASLLPLTLAVGENGAGWSFRDPQTGMLRRGHVLSDGELAAQQQRLDALSQRVLARFGDVVLSADQLARRCDVAFSVGEHRQLPRERIDALLAFIEAAGFATSESSIHVHALGGRWGKADGIARGWQAVRNAPLDPSRWVFVGDSPNDATAFAWFPHSVGVHNVREHLGKLQHRPRYVTHASRGQGFAEVVDWLLNARTR